MLNKYKHLIIILFFVVVSVIFSNYNKSDFKLINLSTVKDSEWSQLNRSEGISVMNENGKIIFNQSEYNSNTVFLELENVYLRGIDKGEFGGDLSFIRKGNKQSILIKKGNIKFIFELDGKIYFIEGLAHMGIDEGAMYRLDNINGKFSYEKILDFEDAPEAYMIYNDKIYIAGHENFYVIDKLNKKQILKKTFWGGLYPNSLATLDGKNIYVGMRGGYALVNTETGVADFYGLKKQYFINFTKIMAKNKFEI